MRMMKNVMAMWFLLAASCVCGTTNVLESVPDMSTAQVATEADAQQALMRNQSDHPLRYTNYFFSATVAFVIVSDIGEFCKKGDRVWQVHFAKRGVDKDRIAWINAETGKVLLRRHEMSKKTPNQALDATSEPAPGADSSSHQR